MAKVTFIGDPKGVDNSPGVEHKGTFFGRDITVTVPDFIAAKLVNNPHFSVKGYKAPAEPDVSAESIDTCTREQFNAAMDRLSAHKDDETAQALAAAQAKFDEQHAADQAEIARLTALQTTPVVDPAAKPPVEGAQ